MSKEKETSGQKKKQRNMAVFLSLLLFVLLIYAVTIVKIRLGLGG